MTTKLKTAFLGEERRSVLVGSSLTIAKAKGTSIVLVVGKDAGSGTIGVYVKTKLVGRFVLSAKKPLVEQRITVKTGALAGVPVSIKVLAKGKTGVRIDGVAILK